VMTWIRGFMVEVLLPGSLYAENVTHCARLASAAAL